MFPPPSNLAIEYREIIHRAEAFPQPLTLECDFTNSWCEREDGRLAETSHSETIYFQHTSLLACYLFCSHSEPSLALSRMLPLFSMRVDSSFTSSYYCMVD